MLDNYHIAAQALREVQQDLPPYFERQLPRLPTGRLRIYTLSAQIIQTENALLDLGHVQRFVEVYQEVLPLTMGELWALPTMLRLGILECLLSAVSRLTQIAGEVITEIAPAIKPPAQLDDQLLVENSILSLRALAVHDWKSFFETLSLVDVALRQDPARLYAGMDFETRDHYRKVVEEIANSGQDDELAVALCAVSLARAAAVQLTPHPVTASQALPDPSGQEDLKTQPEGWDGFRSQPERAYRILSPGPGTPNPGKGFWVHSERSAAVRALHPLSPNPNLPGPDCCPLAGIDAHPSVLCRHSRGTGSRTSRWFSFSP